MHSFHTICVLLQGILTIAMASPVEPLANLQCHCISFSPPSDPVACALPNSQNLGWTAARQLAATQNLKVEFASKATISKILAVQKPLPTSTLLHMGEPEESSSGSKIVCGLGDEVKRRFLSGNGRQLDPRGGDLYVSKVMAVLLLIIILYSAGEYVWMKYFDKYFDKGRIKLDGGEKDLTTHNEDEPETRHPSQSEKSTGSSTQTNFS